MVEEVLRVRIGLAYHSLGARYMGEDRAEAFGKRNAIPGELLVLGRITKVVALAEIAG